MSSEVKEQVEHIVNSKCLGSKERIDMIEWLRSAKEIWPEDTKVFDSYLFQLTKQHINNGKLIEGSVEK